MFQDTPTIPAEDVRHVYRALLGREPESDAVASAQAQTPGGLEQLIANVASSTERSGAAAAPAPGRDSRFDGLHPGDEDLLRRHLTTADPEAGFVKNFLGVRTRVAYVDVFANVDGVSYRDIPTVQQDYHAEPIEFVGTLRAIEAGTGPFVVVELGAGWGSWSITAGVVARRLGRPVRLYAVEGSAGKVENMKIHFADNGFDPAEHTLVHAAIGPRDGFALFPQVDVTADWGAVALFSETETERDGYEVVRSISLERLLEDEEVVDLIHFDVQGAEGDVIPVAADLLTRKVRYLVVGTHSRSIEGRIIDALLPRGWDLENEQPAQIGHSLNGSEILHADGTQVWRNKAL